MEVSELVNQEHLFELELEHPVTGAPLGITFQVRSAGSDEAKAVLRRHADENMTRQRDGKQITAAILEKQEAEKAASYIAGWAWGDNTFLGEAPEFSFEKAVEVVTILSWAYAQTVKAANRVGNFTKTSGKTSRKQSE